MVFSVVLCQVDDLAFDVNPVQTGGLAGAGDRLLSAGMGARPCQWKQRRGQDAPSFQAHASSPSCVSCLALPRLPHLMQSARPVGSGWIDLSSLFGRPAPPERVVAEANPAYPAAASCDLAAG